MREDSYWKLCLAASKMTPNDPTSCCLCPCKTPPLERGLDLVTSFLWIEYGKTMGCYVRLQDCDFQHVYPSSRLYVSQNLHSEGSKLPHCGLCYGEIQMARNWCLWPIASKGLKLANSYINELGNRSSPSPPLKWLKPWLCESLRK